MARAAGAPPAVGSGENWLAYGRTPDIANAAPVDGLTESALSHLRLAWRRVLDEDVIAQPLYVSHLQIAGKVQPVLFVATGQDSVFALSARTGATLWQHSLGQSFKNVCGGRNGITSTPVIDLARNRLYVIGDHGYLHALDLTTGHEVNGWPVQIVSRTLVEYVWGALRIVDGDIYVPVGNTCDVPDSHGVYPDGRIVAVDPVARKIVHDLDVVPGPANEGGVWALGGVSVDPNDGTLYVGTANAHVVQNGAVVEDAPFGERVLHLTPALHVLGAEGQTFTLATDEGFGSTPLLFQPSGCPPLAAANSKNGATYVWQRGASFGTANVPPLLEARIGPVTVFEFASQPTYVAAARTLVVDGAAITTNGTVVRGPVGFRISADCKFTQTWQANLGGGIGTQPTAIGKAVVTLMSAPGKLAILDAATGRVLSVIVVGQAFSPPIAADGVLYDADEAGTVRAYHASR